MHDDADERVEEDRAGVLPACLVEEWLTFRRLSSGLNSANIVMQAYEQTRYWTRGLQHIQKHCK